MQASGAISPLVRETSRSSSFSSEPRGYSYSRTLGPVTSIPTTAAPAAYVAVSAASQIVTDSHRHRWASDDAGSDTSQSPEHDAVLFSDKALHLINVFLDNLLYTLLATARSTRQSTLRQAVDSVLKGKLARLAIASADEELDGLLADSDEDDHDRNSDSVELMKKGDLEVCWKRTRLRIMVHMRIGELEDEDEERYVEAEGLPAQEDPQWEMPWESAIFLTSILEYVAEEAVIASGKAAFDKISGRKAGKHSREASMNSFFDDERVVVEEHDVEKLAVNSTLGRLWRTWKKQFRAAKAIKTPTSSVPSSPQVPRQTIPIAAFPPDPERAVATSDKTRNVDSAEEDDIDPETSFLLLAVNTPLPVLQHDFFDTAPSDLLRPRSADHRTVFAPTTADGNASIDQSQAVKKRPSHPGRQRSSSAPGQISPSAVDSSTMPLPAFSSFFASAKQTSQDETPPRTPKKDVSAVSPATPRTAKDGTEAEADAEAMSTPSTHPERPPTSMSDVTEIDDDVQVEAKRRTLELARRSLIQPTLNRETSQQSGDSVRDNPFSTPTVKLDMAKERLNAIVPQTSASITDFGSTWAQVDSLMLTKENTAHLVPTTPKSADAASAVSTYHDAMQTINPREVPGTMRKPSSDRGSSSVDTQMARPSSSKEQTTSTTPLKRDRSNIQAIPSPIMVSAFSPTAANGAPAKRPSDAGSERQPRDFTDLVNSDDTIKKSLTPQSVRDLTLPSPSVSSTKQSLPGTPKTPKSPAAVSPLSITPVASSSSGSTPTFVNTSTFLTTETPVSPQAPRVIPRSFPSPSNNNPEKRNGLVARDAMPNVGSTREMAEFLRSSEVPEQAPPPPRKVIPSSVGYRNHNLVSMVNGSNLSKNSRQPREATVSASRNSSADLIAFLRDDPPWMGPGRPDGNVDGNGSISSSGGRGYLSGSNTNHTSMTSSSVRTPENAGNRLSGVPKLPSQPNPLHANPMTGQRQTSAPIRTQYRGKDPYAIDISDDEDDHASESTSDIHDATHLRPQAHRGQVNTARSSDQIFNSTAHSYYNGNGSNPSMNTPVSPIEEDDDHNYTYGRPSGVPSKPQVRASPVGTPSSYSRRSNTADLVDFLKNTPPPDSLGSSYGSSAAPPPVINFSKSQEAAKPKKGLFGRKS